MNTEWRYQNFDRNRYRDFFYDTKFSETETETSFRDQIFPKPRLFSETKFSETKFSDTETETLKDLAKVSKPRSFETEMSISGIKLFNDNDQWCCNELYIWCCDWCDMMFGITVIYIALPWIDYPEPRRTLSKYVLSWPSTGNISCLCSNLPPRAPEYWSVFILSQFSSNLRNWSIENH